MQRIKSSWGGWKTGLLVGLVAVCAVVGARADTYMVIDVSEGPDATEYPVSYTNAVPGGGWTDEHKTTKIVLRRILPATFIMGSPTNEFGRGVLSSADETQHVVKLTDSYYIGVYEVTQKQWERVMDNWPSYFTNATYRESRPVESVSYYRIRESPANSAISPNWPQSSQVHPDSFMGKLRARTGLLTLDLPTEAQWEYACRAGTETALNSGKNVSKYVSGCTNMAEVGRYYYNGGKNGLDNRGCDTNAGTATVGSYQANQWGLYDMHGNVWEWCLDWYGTYPVNVTNPVGDTSGAIRIGRGGGWGSNAGRSRSASRNEYETPNGAATTLGLRIAMSVLTEYVVVPIFSPDDGAYTGSSVSVTVSSATGGATIYYTMDGNEPTEASDTVASGGSVSVPIPGTLKAKAWKAGMNPSDVKSASYALAVPGAPAGVSASSGTYTDKVRISWTAPAGADSYQVWRHTSDNSASASQLSSGITGTTHDDTTATAGVAYYYWVKAVNAAGASAFSVSDSGYRLAAPSAPSGVSATDGTFTDKVRIAWTATANADSYQVWRHTSNNSNGASQLATATGTSYDDATAVAGTTYYYWIKAVNAAGASGISAADIGYLGVVGPLISVNGMVGDTVRVSSSTPLTVLVEVMHLPSGYIGYDVDWWVVAYEHNGGFWYYLNSLMAFTPFDGNFVNCMPAYQGALNNLPQYKVAEGVTLAPGTYNIWFAVDYPMDGVLNIYGQILWSRVTVVVE